MNRNEVEQWMKDSLEARDYTPGEDAWKKLQEAIVPPAKKNVLPFIGILPTGWKAAASILLVVAAGTIIYLFSDKNNGSGNPVAVKKETTHRVSPSGDVYTKPKADEDVTRKQGTLAIPTSIASERKLVPGPNRISSSPATVTLVKPIAATTTQPPQHKVIDPASPSLQNDKDIVIAPSEKVQEKRPVSIYPDLEPEFVETPDRFNSNLNLGIAAQAGRASVGNMRYQVGVVARKNISARFYTTATLALASTAVTSSHQKTFQSVSVNPVLTSTGSIGTTNVEEKSVEARYGNDVISIGVSPSVGYHVTPRLAVAAGVALYRNLDQSLTLKNEESIDRATLSNNVISSSQQIGKWDAGITGSASYNVSRKLAVDVQYRYGLSTYMRQDDQAVRNSGVGLGLNYMFGRP